MKRTMATDLALDFLDVLEVMVVFITQDFHDYTRQEQVRLLRETEWLFSCCVALEEDFPGPRTGPQALTLSICRLIDSMEECILKDYSSEQGHPRHIINEQQLHFLASNDFCLTDMAAMLNCSVRTIQRCLQEIGLSRSERYSSLSDVDIDHQIKDIHSRQ